MEDVIAVAGSLGVFAFVIWAFLQSVLRWREISRESQIMAQLVAQVRSGEEAATFLESSSARSLFGRMVDRKTLVLQRVLRAFQAGVVLLLLGIAIFVIRTQFANDEAVEALVLGTLSLTLGIAFLVAGFMSYALSMRWGLLEEPD